MPLVSVKLIKGVFDAQQREQMIGALTDAMVSVEGESLRRLTWVTIEEIEGGDWGIGGQAMRASDVKQLQTGG